MKGTPQFPQCGFSGQVVQILDHLRRAPTKASTCWNPTTCATASRPIRNWPTIPQLYVKGEFVGGCDIVREMFQAGELQQTLKDKGVAGQADRLSGRRCRGQGAPRHRGGRRSGSGRAADRRLRIHSSASGPESAHGGGLLLAAYGAAVIACVALPVAGFVFNARGKAGLGLRTPGCRHCGIDCDGDPAPDG